MIAVPEEDRTREARLVLVREYLDKVWPELDLADELPMNPRPSDYQVALSQRIGEVHSCFRCPNRATSAYVQHRLGEYPRWLDLCQDCSFWMVGKDTPSPDALAEIHRLAGRPELDT